MYKAFVEMSENGSKLQYFIVTVAAFRKVFHIVYLFHEFYAFNELIVN